MRRNHLKISVTCFLPPLFGVHPKFFQIILKSVYCIPVKVLYFTIVHSSATLTPKNLLNNYAISRHTVYQYM